MDRTLDRIDAALARLERAAELPPAGDAELAARHDRLKASVSKALGQLDDLIAGQRK